MVAILISAVGISQNTMDPSLSANQLIKDIFPARHSGLVISNVSYSGPSNSLVWFYSTDSSSCFSEGIIISSGNANRAFDRKNSSKKRSYSISPSHKADTVSLEFDFLSETNMLIFDYCLFSPDTLSENKIGNNETLEISISGTGKRIVSLTDKQKLAQASFNVEAFNNYHIRIAISDKGQQLPAPYLLLKAHSFHCVKPKIDLPSPILSDLVLSFDSLSGKLSYSPDTSAAILSFNIPYPPDSYNLESEYFPVLEDIFEVLRNNIYINIEVNSYTEFDTKPNYYLRLAEERAKYIAYYFISKGIALKRITYSGLIGSQKARFLKSANPKMDGRNMEIVFKNRR